MTNTTTTTTYGTVHQPQHQPQYQPQYQQAIPQQQYQQQQQQPMMIQQTAVIATPSNIKQYPNNGPVVEALVESTSTFNGTTLSLSSSPQYLSNALGVYGFPNAANSPADMEASIIQPLNRILQAYYNSITSYDTYYMVTFVILMIFIIFTMGLGVVFIFVIFIFPFLKSRHIATFDDTVKVQIRSLLAKENQTKYMPHGFEWVINYVARPSAGSFLGGFTCAQDATLKLLRVSRQVQAQQDTLVM